MNTRFWMLGVTMGAMLACSSAPQTGYGPGGALTSDEAGGGGDDGGGASSSGTGSSSGGTGGGMSDANAAPVHYSDAASQNYFDTFIPDAEVAQTVTLTITPFTVAPGDEVFMCQQFANPFGKDADLVEMVGQMATGSHHFFVFNMSPDTGRNVALANSPCPGAGLEFHPYIYLSQTPNQTITYPQADMGYPLPAANGLMMNLHYLNATSETLTASATITITAAKPGVVTTRVGNLFLNNGELSVPPSTTPVWYSKTTVPIADHDYFIVQSFSHMHSWGKDFQATMGATTSTPFYDDTNWSNPHVQYYTPPLSVPSGTAINWQCQYLNDTNPPTTLTFGDSAKNNVMCIYFGMYYPVTEATTDPNYPDIVTPL